MRYGTRSSPNERRQRGRLKPRFSKPISARDRKRHARREHARIPMINPFQKAQILIALISMLASPTDAAGTKPTLASDFADFPAPKIYRGSPHRPDFRGRDREHVGFKTRICMGLKAGPNCARPKIGPNFAGKYSLIEFGCGTGGCVMGFVTDLTTGRVLPLPVEGENYMYLDLSYRLDSRLISARWVSGGRCMQQKFTITDAQFDKSEVKDIGSEDACY